MTENVEIDYAQYQVDTLRENLEMIQSNIELLAPYMDKNEIRKDISLWRLCITTQKRHYPKPPQMFEEMNRFDIKRLFAMTIEYPPTHQDLKDYMLRLRDLLKFPQRYHDNYDDMFPPVDENGQRMLSELGYRDFLLKELQAKKPEPGELHTTDEQPYVDMQSKKFKRDYKKYVEEWRAKYVKERKEQDD